MCSDDTLEELVYQELACLWLDTCFPDLPAPGDPNDPLTLSAVRAVLSAISERAGYDSTKDLASLIECSLARKLGEPIEAQS